VAERDRVGVGEHRRRDRDRFGFPPILGNTQATLPLAQLVALGKRSASGLNDPRVKTALVVRTTKHAAEDWLEPGAISPGAADPRAYLIVLTGRFICTHCSYPAGAKPPRGPSAQIIWVPGQGVSDFGLTQRMPGDWRSSGI
jgi:hypothetical protein